MTPTDFLCQLESVLQERRESFDRAAAIIFVESCWELIDDNPDAWYWAERFVEAGASASGKLPEAVDLHRC